MKTMAELGLCTVERQAEIEAHWAKVRAGIKKPAPPTHEEILQAKEMRLNYHLLQVTLLQAEILELSD